MKQLFTGRWIAVTATALVACAIMLALAQWQWSQAQNREKNPPATVVPVDSVVRLDIGVTVNTIGFPVSALGVYNPATQVRVADQSVAGRQVDWVVTALRESGGVLVSVVRGYVPKGAPLPVPPRGQVRVTGVLQASDDRGADYSPITSVSTWALTQKWHSRLRDGYVVLRTSQPDQSGLETIPGSAIHVHRGLPVWRNLAYAVQWVVFAGFVVFFWLRASRDQVRAKREQNEGEVSAVAALSQPTSVRGDS